MQPEHQNDLDKRLSRLYAAPVPESFETGWRADIRREESMENMNKSNWRPMWRKLVPALCVMVFVLGGLWAGTLEEKGDYAETQHAMVTTSRMASGASNGNAKLAANYSMMAVEEAAYDTAAAYDYGVTTYGAIPQENRKLVRTADLTIRTNAFEAAVDQVQDTLNDMGGYIENLYQYGENVRRLNLSMRVPSSQLDAFLASMEGAGRVTDRSESTTDMTVQYQDNQARLDTLYQKRDRLNELLQKAETVSDLIEIESAIADTQYQIDSYETSQRSIDRQVDMSAVNLTIVEEEQTVVNPELTLAERIRAGFIDSVNWLEELARNMVVFAVMAAPVIALIAVVWLGWKLIQKIRNRRK